MSISHACLSTAVRTVNRGARLLHRLGRELPELSPDTLVASARRRARLGDFGTRAIHNSLGRLVEAIEREAGLTPLGRLTVRRHLVSLLVTALELQRERVRSPSVATQRITAPIFILGLPRTGTTLLHNLMVQDPRARAPLTWEVMFPAGFRESPHGLRRARKQAATRLAWVDRFDPGFKRIHPLGADRPEECVALMAPGFTSALFHTLYRVPSYQDWFESDPQTLGFEFHFRMLQQLQSRRGAGRWVLKGPAHLFSLKALLARYPDARLIQTHRDPLRAVPSIASLNTALRRAFSDQVDPEEIGRDCAERLGRALHRFLDQRDRLPPERVVDVDYTDLTASPLSAVKRIYRLLGWSFPSSVQAAMRSYLAENPKGVYGTHRYSLQRFGLDPGEEANRFARYCARFRIRRETNSAM